MAHTRIQKPCEKKFDRLGVPELKTLFVIESIHGHFEAREVGRDQMVILVY